MSTGVRLTVRGLSRRSVVAFAAGVLLLLSTDVSAEGVSTRGARSTRSDRVAPAEPASSGPGAIRDRLATLQRRTDRSLATSRRKIQGLETEITRLEAEHAAKEQAARTLRDSIVARKAVIQGNHDRTRRVSMFGALMGMPLVATVGILKMMEDDARLRELNASLRTADADRVALESQIQAHKATKDALLSKLVELRTSEAPIAAEIARVQVALASPPRSLDQVKGALGLSRVLLSNLRGQVRLLSSIRKSAAQLSTTLDDHLRFLERQIARAERLVTESTDAYLDYVKLVVSNDPEAAAGRWLERRFVGRVATMLQEAGLDREVALQLAERLIPRSAGAIASRRFAGAVSAEMGSREAASLVNPINIFGSATNCGEVSLAVAHRLRGREVVALPSDPTTLGEVEKLANASFQPSTTASAEAELLRRGEGADAIVFGQRPGDPIGHVWNIVNRGGRIEHLDGQVWTAGRVAPMPVRAVMLLPPGSRWPAPEGYPGR